MKKIKNFSEFSRIDEKNPCWSEYKQIGTKKKKGKIVPNCVPVSESGGQSIQCEECGWTWELDKGGSDPYTCHKCGHDNTPKRKQTFDYGCSMIYYDFPKIDEIHSMIDEDHLYSEEGDRSYGLEKEPHTTLLFGLHSDEIQDDDVMHASTCHEIPNELKLHNPSLFKNDKYDVLKFDVAGDNLHKLNAELAKLPHTTDYPDYHPHSTIGYLKKGMGDKYVSLLQGSEYTVNPSKIVYSKPDGSKIEKEIKG